MASAFFASTSLWAARLVTHEVLVSLLSLIIVCLIYRLLGLKRCEHEYEELARRATKREATLEKRYRELLDNSSDIVYTHDCEGHLITWSKAGELITGYTQQDLFGKNLADLVPSDQRPAFQRLIKDLVQGEGPATFEIHILAEDESPVTLEVSTREIRQDGQLVGLLGFARDITGRKRSQEALKASKVEAEHARQAAEAASKAKSEFLANMSHEIRTPLNCVLGMTELTLDTKLTSEQREYMELVRGAADSLLTLINDLLDFSKVEAGKLELDFHRFDLRELVESTVKQVAVRARHKRLKVKAEIEPGTGAEFLGDAGRLRQVLLNLIGNAIKFTERGSVTVRVRPDLQSENEAVLCFEVTDTGIGIPPEKQQMIFEPFAQADGSTTRRFGGTGLGLSISRQMIELMNGHLGVRSEPGRGSTFYFTIRLPRISDASLAENPSDPVSCGKADGRPSLRILVAEDSPTNLKLTRYILEREGHEVHVARNGLEAIEAFTNAGEKGFNLALMDLQMPKMDGLEATAAIRQRERPSGPHLPIIAVTAHALKGDRERCLAAGMDAYISKPIHREELLHLIETLAYLPPRGHQSFLASTAKDVLDTAQSLDGACGDADLLRELAEIFLRISPAQVEESRQALAQRDFTTLGRTVHSLKSSLSNFSAKAAQRAVFSLEQSIAQGNYQEIQEAYAVLENELQRLTGALQKLMQGARSVQGQDSPVEVSFRTSGSA